MKWLKDLWNRIVSSNDEPYLQKIKELEEELKDANEEIVRIDNVIDGWIANYEEMKRQYESMQKTKNELLEELDILKFKDPMVEKSPDIFLNDNSNIIPYFGSWNVYYWKNGMKVKKVNLTPKKLYSIWDDDFFQEVKKQVKGMDPVKNWYDVAIKLYNWKFTLGIKYEHDLGPNGEKGENWRLVPEIYHGQIDDCDRTTLFIVACRIAGIPSDKVFHITGTYNQLGKEIGHSFAGLYNYKNEFEILEMTQKRIPVKMIGSDYKCKGILSGITNWQFQGQPKKEQW